MPLVRDHLARVATGDVEVEAAGRLRCHGVPRDAVPALVHALADAGVTLYELRRLDPTLEDVYLALHGRVPADGPPREVPR